MRSPSQIIHALMDRAKRDTSVPRSGADLLRAVKRKPQSEGGELAAAKDAALKSLMPESEMIFHGLVNQSLIGFYIMQEGKFIYTNQKFQEMYGYSGDEMKAMNPDDLAAERDLPRLLENVGKRFAEGADHVRDVFHGVHKNGTEIDVEIYGNITQINSRRTMMGLALDITERVRAEREVKILQERLHEEAIRDGLTGLYNRRYLEETLCRETISAIRQGYPVSVVMADLDHFKLVNDHYGHLAGDAVLRAFGDLLKNQARGSDICCRYGGEEFLLVMPGMTEGQAVERAEQLRSALAAAPVVFGSISIPVTASFGIATFSRDGSTSDELIEAADSALYAAKEGGRNRISVAAC